MEVLKLENGKLVSKQLKKEEYYSVTINFYDREDTILKAESLWDLFLVWQRFKNEAGITSNKEAIFKFYRNILRHDKEVYEIKLENIKEYIIRTVYTELLNDNKTISDLELAKLLLDKVEVSKLNKVIDYLIDKIDFDKLFNNEEKEKIEEYMNKLII